MNMDGIEWKRDKWSRSQRLWLRLNEYAGAKLSTHLIADHPEIGSHLSRIVSPDKISVIQYGATAVRSADETLLQTWRLRPHEYAICIARPEPENSLLEIVRSFSTRPRGYRLVVLGRFHADNPYHAQVRASASDEVLFPGAIYEHRQIQALRFFAKFYLHGHTVGGTNPSLVEALAAGNAVVARRNPFNQWVAGAGARYFSEEGELERIYEELSEHPEELGRMRIASVIRHAESFTDDAVNERYVRLFERFSEPASSLPEHAGQTSTG
jgi:glycosyltransferase involved in cell wall biosynthesis